MFIYNLLQVTGQLWLDSSLDLHWVKHFGDRYLALCGEEIRAVSHCQKANSSWSKATGSLSQRDGIRDRQVSLQPCQDQASFPQQAVAKCQRQANHAAHPVHSPVADVPFEAAFGKAAFAAAAPSQVDSRQALFRGQRQPLGRSAERFSRPKSATGGRPNAFSYKRQSTLAGGPSSFQPTSRFEPVG